MSLRVETLTYTGVAIWVSYNTSASPLLKGRPAAGSDRKRFESKT